jgi:TRAP-type C4-dicarboxylate transport system substrate-binding protein
MELRRLLAVALSVCGCCGVARAERVTLRMAAVAPEGTTWAREMHAFAREVEAATKGEVRIKLYLGGIAGDERTSVDRVSRGQLDILTGSFLCQPLAPSLHVIRIVGLYRSRDEASYVLGRIKPMLDEEFRRSGFTDLGLSLFGGDVLFSRRPVRSMAELRALRWWVWNLDPVWKITAPALGVNIVATSLDALASTFQSGAVDGFIVFPTAALSFQWSSMATFFSPLEVSFLPACLVISNVALDPLPLDAQQALYDAGRKLALRTSLQSSSLEGSLVGGLFEKQGLKKTDVPVQFRAEFFATAKSARDQLGAQLVPPHVLAQVEEVLEEYRSRPRQTGQH